MIWPILASFQQSMLTFQEHILVSHLILPHFSNLCSHFRNICWSLISFYLGDKHFSLILAIYAHILDKGTRNKMEDKFCNYILALILIFLQQKIFQTMLTFQELMLVSHLILPWRQAFQPHFSNLCSHFRNICWSLISFYLGDKHFSLILAIYAHILDKGTRNKMEDKFCNYILALILIFLQQKIFQTMLTFQELMLVSHLILPWRQAFQPHFSNLCSHFRKSVLTFQEHILVSHLILPPVSLILAIYAHILGTHAGVSSHFTLETSILAHFLHILAGFHFFAFFLSKLVVFPT